LSSSLSRNSVPMLHAQSYQLCRDPKASSLRLQKPQCPILYYRYHAQATTSESWTNPCNGYARQPVTLRTTNSKHQACHAHACRFINMHSASSQLQSRPQVSQPRHTNRQSQVNSFSTLKAYKPRNTNKATKQNILVSFGPRICWRSTICSSIPAPSAPAYYLPLPSNVTVAPSHPCCSGSIVTHCHFDVRAAQAHSWSQNRQTARRNSHTQHKAHHTDSGKNDSHIICTLVIII